MALEGKELRLCQNIVNGIFKNVRNKQYECMVDGCNNKAINSHVLMQKGVLRFVAEKGKVVELRAKPIEASRKGERNFGFKKVGVSQALSLPLFCNYHDTTLFEEIEKQAVDYSNYRHLSLFCYRALCAAIRKKEMDVERDNRMRRSNILNSLIPEYIHYLARKEHATQLALSDLNYYRKEFLNDLSNNIVSFSFSKKELPIKGIYASTTSNMFLTEEEAMSPNTANLLFIHLIPTKDNTTLLLGYHKNHISPNYLPYIKRWEKANISDIGNMLTGILIQSENWGMSPSLYAELSKQAEEEFYRLYKWDIKQLNQEPYEKLNLFDGIF